MKKLLLALAIVFGLGSYPAQAQNCYTVNGVQTCASSLRLFDSTARSASQPVLDLTQTWLNPATTFTGLRLNVTDSGSATGSLLFDMQVGGTSKFSINKSGNVVFAGTFAPTGQTLFADGTALAPGAAFASQPGLGFYRTGASSVGFTLGSANPAALLNGNVVLAADGQLIWTNTTGNANATQDTTMARSSAGVFTVNGVPTVVFVTADFSTTSVSLATITGLSWTLPANTARNIPFSCKLYYSQATAAVADAFGFQVATVAPTNAQVGGAVETALGTTAYGDATFTTTTAANVVAFTPGSIATIFNAYIDGFIENPSSGSVATVNLMALTGNAADALTVKRGSFCRIY